MTQPTTPSSTHLCKRMKKAVGAKFYCNFIFAFPLAQNGLKLVKFIRYRVGALS